MTLKVTIFKRRKLAILKKKNYIMPFQDDDEKTIITIIILTKIMKKPSIMFKIKFYVLNKNKSILRAMT